MSIVVAGLEHHSCPSEVLGAVAVEPDQLGALLDRLMKSSHIAEAVVLSTCVRTEVYVDALRFHGAIEDIHDALGDMTRLSSGDLDSYGFELWDDEACEHLFRVAAGIESVVPGEGEVLRQAKVAWQTAQQHGACRTILGGLFRHAVEASKRARSTTAIARGTTSIGHAAVAMAAKHVGEMQTASILVVGAGEMGDSMAAALNAAKRSHAITVTNRTADRAQRLANRIGARTIPFEEIHHALQDVDVVFSSTGSTDPVLTVAMIEATMAAREHQLVIVDMGVPADVESGASRIENVTVLDLSDLNSFADSGTAKRRAEIAAAEEVIGDELERYNASVSSRAVAPLVTALRTHVENIRIQELARMNSRLDVLGETERSLVDEATRSIVRRLLHDPTVNLKHAASTPDGERMANALRMLFGL